MVVKGNGEEDETPEGKHRRTAQGSNSEETRNQNPPGRPGVQAEAANKGAEGAGGGAGVSGWPEGTLWAIRGCSNIVWAHVGDQRQQKYRLPG